MSASDHELMRRLQGGETAAFEQLVRRWEGKVTRVLTRLVRDASEVEDLRQETFLRLLTGCQRYRERGAFSTWLYRIALNLARDAARRRRRRRILPLGDVEVGDDGADTLTRTANGDVRDRVRASLLALPMKLQEVLVLKHYGDLSFSQIAEVLEKPVGTVKSRLRIGLRELHTELGKHGINGAELE